jgi:hypothetical protein
MRSATAIVDGSAQASWRVSRDGSLMAEVSLREEGGEVVVFAGVSGLEKPYRFATLQSADAFINDLITSFAYLGCDVAKAG